MSRWWDISGSLYVEELATTRVLRRRPLVGVSIDIAGWPDERACFGHWGHTHTDSSGRFRLRVNRPAWAHRLRVTASLVGELLVVCDETSRGIAGRRPIHLFEPDEPIEGPEVDIGTIVVGGGAAGELGSQSAVRRAISWYAARSTMEYLASLGEGLSLRRRIAIVCPSDQGRASIRPRTVGGGGPLTLLDDRPHEWSIDMVVHQVMRHWARQCIAQRIAWPTSRLSIPADDHFVELAKDELMRQLWGRQSTPGTRRVSGY